MQLRFFVHCFNIVFCVPASLLLLVISLCACFTLTLTLLYVCFSVFPTLLNICLPNSSFLNLSLHLFCLDLLLWHSQEFLDKMDKLKTSNIQLFLQFSENSRNTYEEVCMLLGQVSTKPKQIDKTIETKIGRVSYCFYTGCFHSKKTNSISKLYCVVHVPPEIL